LTAAEAIVRCRLTGALRWEVEAGDGAAAASRGAGDSGARRAVAVPTVNERLAVRTALAATTSFIVYGFGWGGTLMQNLRRAT